MFWLISLFTLWLQTEPRLIKKIITQGGYLVVPDTCKWVPQQITLLQSSTYSLIANKNLFKTENKPGDTLWAHYYIPELELIQQQGMFQYQFLMQEQHVKK